MYFPSNKSLNWTLNFTRYSGLFFRALCIVITETPTVMR